MLSQENQSQSPEHFVLPAKRFVTGALDNKVKVWTFVDNSFKETEVLTGHTDWVRDVAWCNNIGMMTDTIASCSEDQTVRIWKKNQNKFEEAQVIKNANGPVWKVSWSPLGNILAIATGENQFIFYKENMNGEYVQES